MEVKPGIGIGDLKFGMRYSEVEELLGEPDKQKYDSDDPNRLLIEYNRYKLRLVFYKDEGNRLGYIHSKASSTSYKGNIVIGMSIEEAMKDVFDDLKVKWQKDEYDYWCTYGDYEYWLTLNEEYGKVYEIELGICIDDNDKYVWANE